MGLGRNESKHISCDFQGHEDDCPKSCAKCAISIKTDGDAALMSNDIATAIRQYKKAVFVEPKFAEAWCNLANAYGMRSEYNNAINAFNKAIAIDPSYGKALFGKAITLRNLGKNDAAMTLANEILEMYDDDQVKKFKSELKKAGVRDTSGIYSLEKAIDVMTDKAYDIIQEKNLLDANDKVSTEKPIYQKEDFAKHIYQFCARRYRSLGNEKIWNESVLAAFYGSLCLTLSYYKAPTDFNGVSAYDYVSDHFNLEELDRKAERLLGVSEDDRCKEEIWNIIQPFAQYCIGIIAGVEPETDIEAAVRDATESAFVMGMLYAMRFKEEQDRRNNRLSIDLALEKLADSTKDYNYTPPDRSAMCYSIRVPDEVHLYFICSNCGQHSSISVYDSGGSEQKIVEQYRQVAAEFTKLGYPAKVSCLCDNCADRLYPARNRYSKNNIVFSVTRAGYLKPVCSFPSTSRFSDFEYRVALAFLKGADTVSKLSEQTNTELSAQAYIDHVHEVLGDVSDKLGKK